jgi:hypothetical protein
MLRAFCFILARRITANEEQADHIVST